MAGANALNLVLKRVLRYFLKVLPLKKIFQFQDRICFFIKNTKRTTLKQVTREEKPMLGCYNFF